MTDRMHKLCYVLTLAALLFSCSGCRRSATDTPTPESAAATDERARDEGADQEQRYPRELLKGATLKAPALQDVVQRLPTAPKKDAAAPSLRSASSEGQPAIFRLPPSTSENTDLPHANNNLEIQVSDSFVNMNRLPDIAVNVAPAKQDVAVDPVDASSPDVLPSDDNAEMIAREQSLWAAARAHSAWTEVDEVTPALEGQNISQASPPIQEELDPPTRLPIVVEEPSQWSAPVAVPQEKRSPATLESSTATEVAIDDTAEDAGEDAVLIQPPRVDHMRAVNDQAVRKIRHAFSLAQRGATYSARVELVEALRTIAEALDMRDGSREHTDALQQAFRALEEANDFHQRGLAEELDMEVLVSAHRTPVLKEHDLTKVTPLFGLQQYLTYAQQQLTFAAGEQSTASLALYGLGRLQVDLSAAEKDALPQAIVFHQAAVLVDSMNYKAANELGVLLAKYGQYVEARDMLAHSVHVCPEVASWRNLAKIHAHLGEADLARRAMHESQLASQSGARRNSQVRWVDPATLAGTIETAEPVRRAPVTQEVESASPERNASQRESEGRMRLIPWMRRGE